MAIDQDAGESGAVGRGRRVAAAGLVAVLAVLVVGLAWVVLVPGAAAWWLEHVDGVKLGGKDGLKGKDLVDALGSVRSGAMTFGTGLLAAVAIYYTGSNAASARRTAQAAQENVAAAQRAADAAHRSAEITEEGQRRTLELTGQGQVTGRYTAAIEQLGSDKLDIRLGGIYALERIAGDSARDHPTVMEVLVTFLREHLADPDARSAVARRDQGDGGAREPETSPGGQRYQLHRLRADLYAAANVIGRRKPDNDTRRPNLARLDLSGLDLAGLHLTGTDLTDANLTRANLTRADLTDAELVHADLTDANLTSANLADVVMFGADLTDANLTDANLRDANLRDANLDRANLCDANLGGATLALVYLASANLTRANLTDANLRDANLGGANLRDANLGGANLRDANLGGADLADADLTGTDLTDAKLVGAVWSYATVWPERQIRERARAGSVPHGEGRHRVRDW